MLLVCVTRQRLLVCCLHSGSTLLRLCCPLENNPQPDISERGDQKSGQRRRAQQERIGWLQKNQAPQVDKHEQCSQDIAEIA